MKLVSSKIFRGIKTRAYLHQRFAILQNKKVQQSFWLNKHNKGNNMYEVKSLNEECGVFGIWGHPQAAQVTYLDSIVCSTEVKKAQGF